MDPTPAAAALPASDPAHRRVGTLAYTRGGLIALFVWLLWGDFCYTLHEVVVHSVLPLTFRRHGAPNFLMGLVLVSLPAVINFTTNPIISTASDRTRTRWGRRRPYLLLSAPINAICLILLAFSEDLGLSLHRTWLARLAGWSPSVTIVTVIALCFVMFKITDMFVSTVYYYLFNDVVPTAFLARCLALFRVVGTLAVMLYNYFLYQYAEHHMREIFLGAAMLYMLGYTLMCVKVREGAYPPPPGGMERRRGLAGVIRTFMKECFFHKFYWYFFLTNAMWQVSGACGTFAVFLNRDSLGLTLNQIGKVGAFTAGATAILMYPAGMLADRIHPLRFMLRTMILQSIWGLVGLNWLFWNPSPRVVLGLIISLSVVTVPLSAMHQAAAFPMYMRLLPKERFGQFSAANAMVISLCAIAGGALAGGFIDSMKWVHHGSNFAYRYIPVWQLIFMWVGMIFLYLLHREWKRLGGLDHYEPPSPEPSPVAVGPAAGLAPAE